MLKNIKLKKETFHNILNQREGILYAYDYDRFSDLPDDCEFFEKDGVLMIKSFDEDTYCIYAWLDKDICYEDFFKEYIDDEKCEYVEASTCEFLPTGITRYFGGLCFTKKGEEYQDDKVKKIGEENSKEILQFCDDLEKGNYFAKGEAETFRYIVEEKLFTTYGIFEDEKLVGMIFYRLISEKKLGVISELAVLPDYQGKGYGKRLVKKALSLYPGYDYIYTCHKEELSLYGS